ncbi:MAG TPA: HAD family hydrolase [Nitrososphaerales archaeon]|nr:HAD family hydrolase [Nitrososphaerales archaeon]
MRAVLFDVDGTLMSFEFDVQGTRKAMIDTLSGMGMDVSGLALSLPTQAILGWARNQCGDGRAWEYSQVRAALYSVLDGFEMESSAKARVLEGTKPALEAIGARSRLAVVTNSGRAAADKMLDRAGIRSLFEFVLTRDDVEEMKPGPAGLVKALGILQVSPSDAVYVGDSLLDILAGKAAGIRVISIATGLYSRERLKSEGAEFVLGSISELPSVLSSMRGSSP